MPSFQPIRFGKYLLLEKLATGGMAQLYRAKTIGVQGFEKFVAIKTILPHLAEEKELVSSFIDEAKLAALLHHHHIVQIYDFGSMEDSYFITMEYLSGKDLRRVAAKAREQGLPISLENALLIAARTCAGLDYAHNIRDFQGKPLAIIHRDISPQNILITYEGDVKIVDFGIAKAASQSTVTQTGMIKGKVAYMSPEQAAGKVIDHRSDIFATGILLYEMIAGTRMFTGEDTLQILLKVRDADYLPLGTVRGGLPPKLLEILDRALAKDPADRYQSCGDMLADIEELMFRLSLRPTSRGLTQYMKELFREEIAAEEAVMREVSGIGVPDAPEAAEEPAAQTAARAPVREEAPATGRGAVPKAADEAAPKGKGNGLMVAVAGVLLAAAVGAFVALRPGGDPAAGPGREAPAAREALTSGQPAVQPAVGAAPGDAAPAAADEAGKPPDSRAMAKELQDRALGLAETDPQEARGLLVQAVALDPASVQGHFQLGHIYVKLKEYPKAVETYRKAADLDPKFPDTFFNLGYVYAVTKEFAKAEEMYGRVVTLSPPYLDEALVNLGLVQEKRGKTRQCIENLERALAVNPGNEVARKYLEKLKGKS